MIQPILLIEDNPQNRYLVRFLLEQNGYEVRCAVDGPEGIQLAETFVPIAILLDIQLPTMDGYDVARALRTIDSLRDVPIVAVTSYAMPGDRASAIEAGCTGYIEKPIDPATFLEQIESMLSPREDRG